ncbi:dihydrofolate reductase family protein [Sphingobacterium psychroaquaticum]|uniref:Dihydrofolate reductase n=1 Tax=Sphingobacterium psychroaquaticum TaxID=561061 RepID=A0A1X7KRJ7_9SPHI|nr:dihydrofolate reductase family protein [Sphingobacterium psychroaquaticum]QBQ40542.1 dihydrofolate reductase [Sphingobacterium psychroaquaticum]SMG43371.1 dihydrofolate reductase [Sphingobacterium psychroaquaticum]
MRKIILDLAITLDGFIEGPNGEIDWCIMDEDMDFTGFLKGIDTIFYGRVSYDAWGNFIPEGEVSVPERELWETVHSKRKIVFSRQEKNDSRATFIREGIEDRVKMMRAEDGKDIWLYGGASLISTFVKLDLIDVYRLSVHPVALGQGKPLFEDLSKRLQLKLKESHAFKSGVVQMVYETKR